MNKSYVYTAAAGPEEPPECPDGLSGCASVLVWGLIMLLSILAGVIGGCHG